MAHRTVWAFFLCFLALACGGAVEDDELGQAEGGDGPMIDRAKASGWAAFEVLTSAQMNALDQNQALMTNSRLVPPYAWALNYGPEFGVDARGGGYHPQSGKWVLLGGAAGSPVCFQTAEFAQFDSGGAVAGGASWEVRDMAVGASGLIVAVGGGTTTASKGRWSSDGGATWNTASTFQNDNAALDSVIYHDQTGLFVAASTSTASTIYTSPDAVTWTLRTVDPTWGSGIGNLATDGRVIIGADNDVTGLPITKYLRTENPLVWTSARRDLPVATRQGGVAHVDTMGFFLLGLSGQVSLRSVDGVDWVTSSGIGGTKPAAHNGILMTTTAGGSNPGELWTSVDWGQTWRLVLGKPAAHSFTRVRYGGGRFVAFSSTTGNASRASLDAN